MKNTVLISLIIPVYGVEPYIGGFARSAFGQSYSHIQYIFVNDGTKDRSMEIVKDILEKEYPNRKEQVVFVDKENAGLPAARRTGLDYVKGDYVYNVDSDDWLSSDTVAKIVAAIKETESEIVYFNYVKEYANRSKIKREYAYSTAEKKKYIRDMFNHKAYGTLCNKCIKYSLYAGNKLFYPRYGYAEDCCMSVQLVGIAKSIAYINEDIYHYRKSNPNAMTRQGAKKRKREYAMNFLALYEKYREVPADENPVVTILDDILIRAGWYSVCYNLGLFKEYSYLAKAVRKTKLNMNSEVPVLFQLLLKFITLFK